MRNVFTIFISLATPATCAESLPERCRFSPSIRVSQGEDVGGLGACDWLDRVNRCGHGRPQQVLTRTASTSSRRVQLARLRLESVGRCCHRGRWRSKGASRSSWCQSKRRRRADSVTFELLGALEVLLPFALGAVDAVANELERDLVLQDELGQLHVHLGRLVQQLVKRTRVRSVRTSQVDAHKRTHGRIAEPGLQVFRRIRPLVES